MHRWGWGCAVSSCVSIRSIWKKKKTVFPAFYCPLKRQFLCVASRGRKRSRASGVAGGSIVQGVLRVGDEIEVRPGIVTKDSEGNVRVSEPLPAAVGWLVDRFLLFYTAVLSPSHRWSFHFHFLSVRFSAWPFFLVSVCFCSVSSDSLRFGLFRFVSFLFVLVFIKIVQTRQLWVVRPIECLRLNFASCVVRQTSWSGIGWVCYLYSVFCNCFLQMVVIVFFAVRFVCSWATFLCCFSSFLSFRFSSPCI